MSVSSLFSKGPTSSGPDVFNAREKAPRDTARFRHCASGCTHAPRPGSTARSSGTNRPSRSTTRSNSLRAARRRQATQVRSESILPASHAQLGLVGSLHRSEHRFPVPRRRFRILNSPRRHYSIARFRPSDTAHYEESGVTAAMKDDHSQYAAEGEGHARRYRQFE